MGVFSLLPLHTYNTHNKPCAHTQNKSSIYMIYVTSSLLLSRHALTLSNSWQWVLASLSLVKSIIAYIIPYPVQLVNWTERNKYYNLTPEFLVISVHDISVRVVEVEKWGDAYQVFDNASLAPFFYWFYLQLRQSLKQPLFVFVTQRAHSLGNRNRGEIALTDSETSLFWLI